MGRSSDTNEYYRLWNGGIILESNSEAQSRMVSFGQIQDDIFEGRSFKIQIIQKIRDGVYLLSVTYPYENKKYNLLVVNLKNSGLTKKEYLYRKRIQVSSKLDDIPNDEPLFVLAAYNAGNKIIYVSSNITSFYKSAKNGNTFSSLWVDFQYLDSCYNNGSCNWFDRKSRFFSAMTDTYAKELSDQEMVARLFASTGIYVNRKIVIGDDNVVLPIDAPVARTSTIRLMPRNKELRRQALRNANYTCELCGTRKTFDTDENSEQYFEGHHLIMYNQMVQDRYRVSLDNVANIVCLCPTCHKAIHYGTDEVKREAVIKLLKKHKNPLFEIYDINTKEDLETIIKDYIDRLSDTGGDNNE